MKIHHLQQFDSFNQKHPETVKNYSQANFKNHNAYLEAREKKLINEMVYDSKVK